MQKEMGPPKILDELACAPFWRNICHRMDEKTKGRKMQSIIHKMLFLTAATEESATLQLMSDQWPRQRNKKMDGPFGMGRLSSGRNSSPWVAITENALKMQFTVKICKWVVEDNIWRIISRQAVKNPFGLLPLLSRVYEQSNMVTTNAHTHFHSLMMVYTRVGQLWITSSCSPI